MAHFSWACGEVTWFSPRKNLRSIAARTRGTFLARPVLMMRSRATGSVEQASRISTTSATFAALVGLASLAAVSPACSSSHEEPRREGTLVVRDDVWGLPQSFSDVVTVEEEQLIVPTAGQKAILAEVRPGEVIVGPPAYQGGNGRNRRGFARRVKAIHTVGDKTEIQTTFVELTEIFKEGRLSFADFVPVEAPANPGQVATQSVYRQSWSKGGEISLFAIKLDEATGAIFRGELADAKEEATKPWYKRMGWGSLAGEGVGELGADKKLEVKLKYGINWDADFDADSSYIEFQGSTGASVARASWKDFLALQAEVQLASEVNVAYTLGGKAVVDLNFAKLAKSAFKSALKKTKASGVVDNIPEIPLQVRAVVGAGIKFSTGAAVTTTLGFNLLQKDATGFEVRDIGLSGKPPFLRTDMTTFGEPSKWAADSYARTSMKTNAAFSIVFPVAFELVLADRVTFYLSSTGFAGEKWTWEKGDNGCAQVDKEYGVDGIGLGLGMNLKKDGLIEKFLGRILDDQYAAGIDLCQTQMVGKAIANCPKQSLPYKAENYASFHPKVTFLAQPGYHPVRLCAGAPPSGECGNCTKDENCALDKNGVPDLKRVCGWAAPGQACTSCVKDKTGCGWCTAKNL